MICRCYFDDQLIQSTFGCFLNYVNEKNNFPGCNYYNGQLCYSTAAPAKHFDEE